MTTMAKCMKEATAEKIRSNCAFNGDRNCDTSMGSKDRERYCQSVLGGEAIERANAEARRRAAESPSLPPTRKAPEAGRSGNASSSGNGRNINGQVITGD